MSNLIRTACLSLATLLATPAFALQVDAMSAWSNASEPLRMDIKLSDLNGAQARDVRVFVASERAHSNVGLSRPAWADAVYFEIIPSGNDAVVARAMGSKPVTDSRVSLLLEIQAGSTGRLQQVYSELGQSALASKSAPKPAATPAPKAIAADPRAKSYDPSAPAPQPKPAKAAAKPAATPAPAPAVEPVTDREALEQGLQAAKAQVADLEAQLAALDAASAPAAEASVDADPMVASSDDMASDMSADMMASADTTEAADMAMDADVTAPDSMVDDTSVAPDASLTKMKAYDLFAYAMMLFVAGILLIFVLIDKISSRRPKSLGRH